MSGKDPPAVKLTYQDYCRIPEDGQRHEILDGEHSVTPAPGTNHQEILVELAAQLVVQLKGKGLGRVFPAPTDLHLSDVDVLQPDLMVILVEHDHIITPTKVEGVPDLVVEVLSPSTGNHDCRRKKERYRKAGVPEYWIVDPDEHVVEQHLLEEGAYRLVGRCERVLRPAVIPEIRIDLTGIW